MTTNPLGQNDSLAHAINTLRGTSAETCVRAITSLLCESTLAANCVRLEAMLGFALKYAEGDQVMGPDAIDDLFARIGDLGAASLEDPSEDLFASVVLFEGQQYRVFEGFWESNVAALQHFAAVIESMPEVPRFASVKAECRLLLALSDRIAERKGLGRHTRGEELPVDTIGHELLNAACSEDSPACFSTQELADIGFTPETLSRFTASLEQYRKRKATNPWLDFRKPLISFGDKVYVLSPSALSPALRHATIASATEHGWNDQLELHLHRAVAFALPYLPELGTQGDAPLLPQRHDCCSIIEYVLQIDTGRHVHILICLDNLKGFPDSTVGDKCPAAQDITERLAFHADRTRDHMRGQKGFREGVSLIVFAGWGRGLGPLLPEEHDDFRVTSLSFPDFEKLCWKTRFEARHIFQILENVDKATRLDQHLAPFGTLLDLFGVSQNTGGFPVPTVNAEAPSSTTFVALPTNASLDLRCLITEQQDVHYAMGMDGSPVRVRRYSNGSFYKSETSAPVYAPDLGVSVPDEFMSLYESPRLTLWFSSEPTSDATRDDRFFIFDNFTSWLRRIGDALSPLVGPAERGPVHWKLVYEPVTDPQSIVPKREIEEEELRPQIRVSVDRSKSQITTMVPATALCTLGQPTNVLERTVLAALVDGALELLEVATAGSAITNQIVPDHTSRFLYMRMAETHSEAVASQLSGWPVPLTELESAWARIGVMQALGHAPEHKASGKDAIGLLRRAAEWAFIQVKAAVGRYERASLLTAALTNSLMARHEVRRWDWSRPALRSLYGDDELNRHTAAQQVHIQNTTSLTSRLLAEAGLCHASDTGFTEVSQLDLARMLAQIELGLMFASVADGMHYGFIEPRVWATGAGTLTWPENALYNSMRDYGLAVEESRAIETSTDARTRSHDDPAVPEQLADEFRRACEASFGWNHEDLVRFNKEVHIEAINRGTPVSIMSIEELHAVTKPTVSREVSEALLNDLILQPRPDWLKHPVSEKLNHHVLPWRYGRDLSIVARPILRLRTDSDKLLVCAGLLEESARSRINQLWFGTADPQEFPGKPIAQWIGSIADEAGSAYSTQVATELESLGWLTETEVELVSLFQDGTLAKFGDIDVIAKHPDRPELMLIECKNLKLAKNPSEIVKQMDEFKGEINKNGKPDRLLKHIRRVDYVAQHFDRLPKKWKSGSTRACGLLAFSKPFAGAFLEDGQFKGMRVVLGDQIRDL
ncbi:MAG: hypothetical protein AAGB51_14065 [Planctomycetota bacterium]